MCQHEPDPLASLEASIADLPGLKPEQSRAIARLVAGPRLLDLLFHLPTAWIDRRETLSVARLVPGTEARVAVRVVQVVPTRRRDAVRVLVADASGTLEVPLFNAAPWMLRRFSIGAALELAGRVTPFDGRVQLPNPAWVAPPDRIPPMECVRPLSAAVGGRALDRAMRLALARLAEAPEWQDPALLRREGWPGFAEALRALQAPEAPPGDKPRERLAYDEVLADQVALARLRARARAVPGRSLHGTGDLRTAALARFGHAPTPAQAAALAEIDRDLEAPSRMLRLLQGDVGSGKTLVAVLALLRAVEAGTQGALMAPTELLANQHHRTLSRLCPVPVGKLTGSVKGRARKLLLAGLADGSVPLVVGTHALFQQAVAFRNLGLAVVDEQHRFGVHQRLLLSAKGVAADVLVMTATPIPRTMLLAEWGEVSVSRLTGKPAGRLPIRTTLHRAAALPEVVAALGRALEAGARVYWVCPLVAESEALDVAAAEARAADLAKHFPGQVGLAHGRQPAAERDAALANLAAGRSRILVATTVVEVGVDVPEASVMVVEQAERFGLAQLHQLRGRVGRGSVQSYCMLIHADATAAARARLAILRDTEDGFKIADADFRLRGGGDLLGTRQSGLPGFRIARPAEDERLFRIAQKDAAVLLARDPALAEPRGRAMQGLLRLMRRDDAVLATVGSG